MSAKLDEFEAEFRRMRPLIIGRSGGTCEVRCPKVCGRAAVHVHHRKLRRQGGDNSWANLTAVCFDCHDWIHGHPSQSYRLGWLVRREDDPAEQPVFVGGTIPVFLAAA